MTPQLKHKTEKKLITNPHKLHTNTVQMHTGVNPDAQI